MKDPDYSTKLHQFEAGLVAGLDPDSSRFAHGSLLGSPLQITTLRSRWLHCRCSSCGHSFRLGDEVRLSDTGQILHDMPSLPCAGGPSLSAPDFACKQAFYQGLDEAWDKPDGDCTERLEGDHYLLAPPSDKRGRAACRVCGHTFRPGDQVVICPCFPNLQAERRRCVAAVHSDSLNQLRCLNDWRNADFTGTCLGMS